MATPAVNDEELEKLAALEEEAKRIKAATDLLEQDTEKALSAEASEDIAHS